MSRGEIWWYEHPAAGRRPCLILTGAGPPAACVLTLDNLEPIRGSFCTGRITRLGPERMAMVCEALSAATGCRTQHHVSLASMSPHGLGLHGS
ncbi:MAG: hypothetical protein WKF96_01715 [Solirubrobacteraceae bacterium]